jgi:hypothetical protein
MTAEEYVVERLLRKEDELAQNEAELIKYASTIVDLKEEIAEYKRLSNILKRHISISEYSITISLKRYDSTHKDDIEDLCDLLGIDLDATEDDEPEEETEDENEVEQ